MAHDGQALADYTSLIYRYSCLSTNIIYARWMGQPTQRATNYTARSNIEPAQIFLHANGQSAPRSGGARDVGRGAGSHTPITASESFSTKHTTRDVRSSCCYFLLANYKGNPKLKWLTMEQALADYASLIYRYLNKCPVLKIVYRRSKRWVEPN